MKKLLFVLAIAAFASCGSGTGSTSADDSTAMKATSDSLAKVSADSLAAVQKASADSAAMKMAADSAHAADSIKAAKGGKKKK